jgi:hypothetical protein
MKRQAIKNWALRNSRRLSLFFLMIMLVILSVTQDVLNRNINLIIAYIFWLSVGIYIGVNWGIEAMKYLRTRDQNNTDYKRSKN